MDLRADRGRAGEQAGGEQAGGELSTLGAGPAPRTFCGITTGAHDPDTTTAPFAATI